MLWTWGFEPSALRFILLKSFDAALRRFFFFFFFFLNKYVRSQDFPTSPKIMEEKSTFVFKSGFLILDPSHPYTEGESGSEASILKTDNVVVYHVPIGPSRGSADERKTPHALLCFRDRFPLPPASCHIYHPRPLPPFFRLSPSFLSFIIHPRFHAMPCQKSLIHLRSRV